MKPRQTAASVDRHRCASGRLGDISHPQRHPKYDPLTGEMHAINYARVGLLPRSATDESEIVWCSIDPCYAFHPLNSYDLDDGRVVVDICRYDKLFDVDRNGPFRDSAPQLEQWTVDPARCRVVRDVIDERSQEFPRVASSVLSQQHRFGYTAALGTELSPWTFGDTIKYDFTNGTSEVHDHGTGRGAGEPVFVSREGGTTEDDGWILATVYDATTD